MHRFPCFGCAVLDAKSILPPSAQMAVHLAGLPSATASMSPLATRFFAAGAGLSSARAANPANPTAQSNAMREIRIRVLLEIERTVVRLPNAELSRRRGAVGNLSLIRYMPPRSG